MTTSQQHVLIVDDEEAVCWTLERALRRDGYSVHVAASAEEALQRARERCPDAILLDVRLPGMNGLAALRPLRELSRNAPVVVVTAHGNLATAIQAMEGGAYDYLAKPFDLDQALEAIRRATLVGAERSEQGPSDAQRPQPAPRPAPPVESELIGRSAVMQQVFKRIALVAPHDACVLITGESGTGKELAARAIHRHSRRRANPFLPINIAALNPNLVESELFGHVKGAYTGASESRPGLLALADGGTVFLDELADIPLPVQAKLLRVLEHQEAAPVGSNQPRRFNIRILAATHQDLLKAVATGTFRHDLYFRLNVFQIRMPALRERVDDIELLARAFLQRIDPNAPPLPAETLDYLRKQRWGGNIRELHHALEHAAILARGTPLRPEHFPTPTTVPGSLPLDRLREAVRVWVAEQIGAAGTNEPAGLYDALLQAVEPVLLEEVLNRVDGNRVTTARWLGLARATLRKLMLRYQLVAAADEPDSP